MGFYCDGWISCQSAMSAAPNNICRSAQQAEDKPQNKIANNY
jgi:hypothetical protein